MNDWISPQFKAAFLRALGGATFAALMALSDALDTDLSTRGIVRITLKAFIGFGLWRTLFEGGWDTMRAMHGRANPADVQPRPEPPLRVARPGGDRPGARG